MDKEKVIYLASLGYSIIPCDMNKRPIGRKQNEYLNAIYDAFEAICEFLKNNNK